MMGQRDPEVEVVRLQAVIADARKAMDEGRMGDVRRILTKGNDKPVISNTAVKARDSGP